MKNILGAQIRAARALLRWAAADLVRESGVSLATIHRAESVDGKTAMTFANASAIRRALENAGVELIEENGGGPGARLKQHVSDQTGSPAASAAHFRGFTGLECQPPFAMKPGTPVSITELSLLRV